MSTIVIQTRRDEMTEGIYGQCLMWVIEVLKDLDESGTITDDTDVIFDVDTLAYGRFIPKYIIPKKNCDNDNAKEPSQVINVTKHKEARGAHAEFPFDMSSFEKAHKVFNKWFEFSPDVLAQIPEGINANTLGVHYRGTDKNLDNLQANPITPAEFVTVVCDYLTNNLVISSIFCCSDEEEFIQLLHTDPYIKSRGIQVIQYHQPRSKDKIQYGFFRVGAKLPDKSRELLTLASMVDMLSLSRCGVVLKTSSALSSFSKIINPAQKAYTVSAMKQRWFPAGVVPPYQSNNPTVQQLLHRTLEGHQMTVLHDADADADAGAQIQTPTPTQEQEQEKLSMDVDDCAGQYCYLNAIWINVDKYKDRAAFMTQQFRDMGWNNNYRVSATTLDTVADTVHMDDYVDGKLEYCCDPSGKFFPNCQNCQIERATLTSHMRALEKGLALGDPCGWFIVFEDDTVIPFELDYKKILEFAPDNAECLQLFCSNPITVRKLYEMYSRNKKLWVPWKMILPSASGYLVSNSGAKRVLNMYKKNDGRFSFKASSSCRLGDVMIYETLCTYTMTYPMFYPNIAMGSIIHPDHLKSHEMGRDTIKDIMDQDPPQLFICSK